MSLLFPLLAAACAKHSPPAERSFVVLGVNDTYRIEGLADAGVGGLPRLRALRATLEARHPDLLVLHAGDLFFPSLLSRSFKGEQMVDALNGLDGDFAARDERLWVVFGNHEFDKDKLEDAALVDARVEQSQFLWLDTNIRWSAGEDGQPRVAAENLRREGIVESGGVKVGLFGVAAFHKKPAYIDGFDDALETARARTASLRAAGAEVVIAVTHQDFAQDEALLRALGPDGPDLVIGGHDHARQCGLVEGRGIYKADADALTAAVVTVTVGAEGVRSEGAYAFLGGEPRPSPLVEGCGATWTEPSPAPDAALQARVQGWLDRFDEQYCREKMNQGPDCLDQKLALLHAPFEAEELRIRRYETGAGDWIADTARAAFAGQGAQIAFVNAGSLRLNQDLPAGAWFTTRHLEEMMAYPTGLNLIRLSGADLQGVVARAIEEWTGGGHWLQVSGFAFVHDPGAGAARNLTLLAPEGARPVRPDEEILAVVPDYLLDQTYGQDGYTMLRPENVVAKGPDLKEVLRTALVAAGENGLRPAAEGRICNTRLAGPCLAVGK